MRTKYYLESLLGYGNNKSEVERSCMLLVLHLSKWLVYIVGLTVCLHPSMCVCMCVCCVCMCVCCVCMCVHACACVCSCVQQAVFKQWLDLLIHLGLLNMLNHGTLATYCGFVQNTIEH